MQDNLPGLTPMQTAIPPNKVLAFALDLGRQMALSQLSDELRAAQKQHPAAVGLTLALAITDKNCAEMRAITTRKILTHAATAGLPLGDHALHSTIENGELIIRAIAAPDGEE